MLDVSLLNAPPEEATASSSLPPDTLVGYEERKKKKQIVANDLQNYFLYREGREEHRFLVPPTNQQTLYQLCDIEDEKIQSLVNSSKGLLSSPNVSKT